MENEIILRNNHNNKKCAVLLVVHKSSLIDDEIISLKRLVKILGDKYDIFLITHKSVDVNYYENLVDNYKFNYVYLDKSNFTFRSYNILYKNDEFFKLFENYEWLLSYELDAFIFEDNIDYFINLDYDYYGAPWSREWCKRYLGVVKECVGNSGFALRKTKAFIDYTSAIVKDNNYQTINVDSYYYLYPGNLNICPVDIAMQFSLDDSPTIFYERLKRLPMGCHIWYRYGNRDFYIKLFKENNIEI